jgi:two-component system, NtrC family, sensor kinase
VTGDMKERSYQLRRRLGGALGLFVAIVVLGAACTVLAATRHSHAMAEMHRWNDIAERMSALASLAREAHIRQSPSDRSAIVTKIVQHASALRGDLSGSDAQIVDWVAGRAPGLANDDRAAEDLVGVTNALNEHFHARSMHVGHSADREALWLVSGSVLAILLAPLLAFIVARRLWRDFELPLGALRGVAERIMRGDRAARVGTLAAAELVVVGQTFDAMLDELERAEQRLVAAERLAAIGRVAAGVAHEINNPIAIIRGYVKMIREETPGEGAHEDLKIIDEEAANCQRIAEDLLAYARTPSINRTRTTAGAILDEAVARLRASGEVGCEVTIEAEPATIDVDAGRLRQVVMNLLRNACEAASAAEAKAAVRLTGTCTAEDGYQISVMDRSPGIPAANRDRLFEPFFTTRNNGTGLGLAVCYGLVTAHGGTIAVADRPGGGTIIRVDLPRVRRHEGETQSS